MTLVKSSLQTKIKSTTKDAAYKACLKMLEKMQEVEINQSKTGITNVVAASKEEIATTFAETFIDNFAEKMASHIHDYILSATITAPPGVTVSVVGTATAQTGATTSPVNSTIS